VGELMATRSKQRDEARTEHARNPSSAEQIASANPASFLGKIIKGVVDTCDDLLGQIKQDTGKGANASRVLAEMFMWAWIKKYAEGKYDKLKKQVEEENVFEDISDRGPGTYIVAESRNFVASANVTEPVRRFSADTLAEWANKQYNIPIIVMKEAIEKAKMPTSSQTRITIIERG
jgi:hypothetical protein